MVNSQNEKIYLLHILKNPGLFSKLKPEFFKNELYRNIFGISKKFFERFNNIPDNYEKTLLAIVQQSKYRDIITDEEVKTLFLEDIEEYSDDWRDSSVKSWIKICEFTYNLTNGVDYIKTQEITPETTDQIINKAKQIITQTEAIFHDDTYISLFDPRTYKTDSGKKITSGKKFVDNILEGGYGEAELIIYLGQQGVGKSIWLCNDAANYSLQGYNVLYVSGEMSDILITKRIGSILFDVPIKRWDEWCEKPERLRKKVEEFDSMGITPGQVVSVQFADPSALDVERLALKYEKELNIKLDVIICDYLGIMSDHRNSKGDNLYVKYKNISKDFRDILIRNKWKLGITAQQIGKDGWDASDLKISNVAESAGIAHNGDVIYGIIQDADMAAENIYWLKGLKFRNGPGTGTKCQFTRNSKTLKVTETNKIKMDG